MCKRLALPRPRGTLDHHIPASNNLVDCERLAAVAVQDMQHVGGQNERVDVRVLGNHAPSALEAVLEEATNECSISDLTTVWPSARVQVSIHQEFCETKIGRAHV